MIHFLDVVYLNKGQNGIAGAAFESSISHSFSHIVFQVICLLLYLVCCIICSIFELCLKFLQRQEIQFIDKSKISGSSTRCGSCITSLLYCSKQITYGTEQIKLASE